MPFFHRTKSFFTFQNTFTLVLTVLFALSVLTFYFVWKTDHDKTLLNQSLSQKEALVASLNTQVKNLLKENSTIKNEDSKKELTTIHNTIEKYEATKAKSADYKAKGAKVDTIESQLPTAVDLILQQKYTDADTLLTSLDTGLETALKDKQAADAAAAAAAAKPKAPAAPTTTCSGVPASGYCRITVNGFSVDVIAGSVSSVITDTANASDCANNCPTKSLQSYVQANGGYAGMNGTYFCPPDYSSCAGKVSSYDFPVYNTNLHKWINQGQLSWSNRAMMAFTSSSAVFYPQTNAYSSLSGLKSAIANFPGLVQNGSNIVGSYTLTSAQYTKSTRGGIAVKGASVYLVIAKSASVPDLAGIMVSMGMTHALNLDGGGSSAMYINGSYKVGPGRSLPNAIILK